jgi:4-amino-4-deoxy-L-arabinose transferase-like glycosyltransferase
MIKCSRLPSFIPLGLALLTVLVSTLCVRPFEHFPINDEWAYGFPVQELFEHGRFVFPGATAYALTQIIFSLPVCLVFGHSYPVLRMVVVLFGLLTCFAMYFFCREIGLKRWTAGLFSLCIACNPFFICLTNVFMSDVFFCAFTLLAFGFIARACKEDRNASWMLSSLFFCLALASRQTALLYIPGILCLLVCRFLNRRSVILPGLLLVVVPIVLYAILDPLIASLTLYAAPIVRYKEALLGVVSKIAAEPLLSLWQLWINATFCLSYLGLLCMPLLIPMAVGALGKEKGRPIVRNCALSLLVAFPLFYLVLWQNTLMPFSNNLLSPPFMGPYILVGYLPAPVEWCKGVTAFSLCLALMLIGMILLCWQRFWHIAAALLQKLRHLRRSEEVCPKSFREFQIQVGCFLFGAFITFLGFLTVQMNALNVDRYFVSLWPLLLAILCTVFCHVCPRRLSILVLPLALAYAAFGTVEGVDYHNFNRTREKCIQYLENRGVSSKEIDGGEEYNFMSNISLLRFYRYNLGCDQEARGTEQTRNLRWWPITGERYIVSKSTIPGYKTIYAAHYWSPLLWRKVDLYVLQRI